MTASHCETKHLYVVKLGWCMAGGRGCRGAGMKFTPATPLVFFMQRFLFVLMHSRVHARRQPQNAVIYVHLYVRAAITFLINCMPVASRGLAMVCTSKPRGGFARDSWKAMFGTGSELCSLFVIDRSAIDCAFCLFTLFQAICACSAHRLFGLAMLFGCLHM